MRRVLQLGIVVVLLAVTSVAGEVLDRVIAIVNNTPVFQSDWEAAIRVEALLDGRAPESFTEEEQKHVFERLVDQELIREQMRGFALPAVTSQELDSRLKDVRAQLHINSDEAWRQLLARDGLSDNELKSRLRSQMEILRFLDTKFRPTVRVDYRTVQQYYRDEFLPKLRQSGGQEVPLSDVVGKIREILTQQRMDEQISNWLQSLRDQADIRTPGQKPDQQIVQNK